MGSFSIWHWMIVLLVVLLLFGTGKVSNADGRLRQGHQVIQEEHGRETTPPWRLAPPSARSGTISGPAATTTAANATAPRETTRAL